MHTIGNHQEAFDRGILESFEENVEHLKIALAGAAIAGLSSQRSAIEYYMRSAKDCAAHLGLERELHAEVCDVSLQFFRGIDDGSISRDDYVRIHDILRPFEKACEVKANQEEQSPPNAHGEGSYEPITICH